MNVRCLLVDTEGRPSVIYCSGRSDIEMNQKIRSIFHFCPAVFMSRALDHKSDVWYGKLPKGNYNKIALTLLGIPVRGPIFITTRKDGSNIVTQQYVDTDWSRITNFLSQIESNHPLSTPQQTRPPMQEQQKRHIHIGAPSLNTISNNTSMGSSVSVTEKSSDEEEVEVEEKEDLSQVCLVPSAKTTNAYAGEGAFTYKPTSVMDSFTASRTLVSMTPEKATSRVVKNSKPRECYFYAQHGNCKKGNECPNLHVRTGFGYLMSPPKEEDHQEEQEIEIEDPPVQRRRSRKTRGDPLPQKRRKSSRIAAQETKKARH